MENRWRSFFLLLLLLPAVTFANPVSFKDGWGIMPTYAPDWSDVEVNYSITNRYSLGVSSFYRNGEDEKAHFGIAQINYLLKRWNEMESQANMYGSLGGGMRSDLDSNDGFGGYARLEGDYETRRIYTLLSLETLQSGGSFDFNRIRHRAGISPYKAPIDELTTWLIVQTEYMPEMEEVWTLTPLIRLFYNNYALEVGSSVRGEIFAAFMGHF